MSLERSGKTNEALALCDAVASTKPVEEGLLSTLGIVYRSIGTYEKITECYEHASAQQPEREPEHHAPGRARSDRKSNV